MRNDEPIAVQVARLRKEKRWTQTQLAKRLRVSQQQVARLEAGGNPSLITLQKAAKALGRRLVVRFV